METKTKLGVPYKRGTGYVYYLGIRDDSGRKKTWFSRVFKTYEEALADSTERQKYLKQIQAQTSPNEKLKYYLDRWLRGKYYFTVSVSTWRCAESHIRLYINPTIGQTKMCMLTDADVEKVMKKCQRSGLSASSTRFVFSTLRSALKQAVKEKIIKSNPCSLVSPPSVKRVRRQLIPPEKTAEFLSLAKKHGIYLEVLFGINFGLRRGEVLGLQFRDFDLQQNLLTPKRQIGYTLKTNQLDKGVPRTDWGVVDNLKTDESYGRELVISPKIKELILYLKDKYVEESVCEKKNIEKCFVCCRADGTFKSPNVLRKRFMAVREEAGMPKLRFHDLRHTFASYMIEDGIPVAVVSAALGHTSITTTLNSYYDVINGGKQIADHMSDKLCDTLVPTEADLKASIRNK